MSIYKTNLRQYLLFAVFPILYLLAQVLMKLNFGYFFISDFDPVYAFLLNGLSLAEGIPGSGLAGFPGTTMQTYLAIIIHIGYLFRDGESMVSDVLQNPEYYLNIAALGIGFINTAAFYLSGLILFKNTGRYDVSLFLQLTPFVSVFGFSYGIFIVCEPFLVFAIQIIMLQVALLYFNQGDTFKQKQLILIGITTSFGIATKIIFAPVFLLSFFIIKSTKEKLKFILYTILSLGIFVIPMYPDLSQFVSWFKMIFFHTRLYGDGDTGIVDLNFMAENIRIIVTGNPVLIVAITLLFIFQITRFHRKFWQKILQKDRRFLNAITIVVLAGIIMFGKHYKPYYMGFFHGLSLLPVIIIVNVFNFNFPNYTLKLNIRRSVSLIFFTGFILMAFLLLKLNDSLMRRNSYRKSVSQIADITGSYPKIIVVHSGSAAFAEGGFNFGLNYSHRRVNVYTELLHQCYPATFFYSSDYNRIFDWHTDFLLPEILSLHQTIFLIKRSGTDTIQPFLGDEINLLKNNGLIKSFTKEYGDKYTYGYLYKIVSDTGKLKKMFIRNDTIRSECETTSSDGRFVLSDDQKYFFEKANMLTNLSAFSGYRSVMLTPEMPYALDIKINAGQNDIIKVYAWRKSTDKKGLIVMDTHCDGIYKASGNVVETCKDWEKINLNFRLPQNFTGNNVHLYLWYNGNDTCFFDDFEIVRLGWAGSKTNGISE